MNIIEIAARKFAGQFDIDAKGFSDLEAEHETKNKILEYVWATFSHRLPVEHLLAKRCEHFTSDTIGEWHGQEYKAARTMQTIFDRALVIAKSRKAEAA